MEGINLINLSLNISGFIKHIKIKMIVVYIRGFTNYILRFKPGR